MNLVGFQQVIPIDVIKQSQKGDSDSFSSIYRTYFSAGYALVYRMSGNQMLAQDIMQEAFIKVMNNLTRYKFEGSFAGWIKKIVVRTAIDHLRVNKHIQFSYETDFDQLPTQTLYDFNWLEHCFDLNQIIEKLPTISRTVLILHEVEGYSHQEIADFYQKSESFSKATLSRAYSKLKQLALVKENKNAS